MIRDAQALRRFEDDFMKKDTQPSFREALHLYESTWKEGITLGVLPFSDPLDGIVVDIELARVLNSLKNSLPKWHPGFPGTASATTSALCSAPISDEAHIYPYR